MATGQNWAMLSSALVSRGINDKHSENTPRELASKPLARSPSTLSKDMTKAFILERKRLTTCNSSSRGGETVGALSFIFLLDLPLLQMTSAQVLTGHDALCLAPMLWQLWSLCSWSSGVGTNRGQGNTAFNVIPEIKVCQFLATRVLAATESIHC